MTSDSHESPDKNIQDLYRTQRRATTAMLTRVALRVGEPVLPNVEDDTLENSIRAAIWKHGRLIEAADPDRLLAPDKPLNLAEAMAGSPLNELATPGRPLTMDRLRQIDPGLVPDAESMKDSVVSWPDDDTVFHDVLPADYDDYAFAHNLSLKSKAHNNFPKLLMTRPSFPEKGEDFMSFGKRTKMFQYATKPYLARAYALQPDFMKALQTNLAATDSPQVWREQLMAAAEEDADPDNKLLLRASRLAYQLLINLMRSDDNQIQSDIISLSLSHEITDPVQELWT